MSNANVTRAISKMLQSARSRQISPTAFDDQLGGYISSLEGLSEAQRRGIRDLGTRFVHASFADEEYPGEDLDVVAAEIEKWLESVPK